MDALASAGEEIHKDPALFSPDRALPGAEPPPGLYRCRTHKLGGRTGLLPYVAYPFFRCRVEADGSFTKLDGSQRPVGRIHRDRAARAVFLGTMLLGDEVRPLRYGRDQRRDLAAWVERVGERRWRMAFPYPHFESTLDLVELVPAQGSVATTGGGTMAGFGVAAGAGSGGSEAR